tara:strand:+ start:166 stop:516 length:351 start_codon:yes stop_codon:yes gene_type:complete
MATPKQEKLVNLLIENYGTEGITKPLGELMIEAGYSPESAKNPKLILEGEGVQEGIKNTVKSLETLREKALTELQARDLSEEPMRDVVKAVDTYTKNHQLLSGGATENNDINIKWQ